MKILIYFFAPGLHPRTYTHRENKEFGNPYVDSRILGILWAWECAKF